MTKVFIIAEAGVNHNGDLSMAYQLVDVAVAAGADAVKFQTAIPELVVTSYGQKADYQKNTTAEEESQLEMIRKILFPLEVYKDIRKYCEEKGILFFSTAFDLVSLDFLEKMGQPYHKVPSGEITNLPYLRQMGGYGRPIILSTGMANMGEIEAALDVLEQAGTHRGDITVLHCNTEYPTPMSDVNLRAMATMRDAFGVRVGYSDHTEGIEVAIAAVALGATMLEKHFTLDRNLPGPDHQASLEPGEIKAMVAGVRNIERAMGDGIKRSSASETRNKGIARRSLVATSVIRAGEVFTKENLAAKRPGTGLSPMRWDEILGRKAPRDFKPDEMIEL
jgi:N,N'-diacetyllegionaminate synthase